MYGMLYSIKSFVQRLSPKPSKDGFYYYSTSAYKLHFYESPSGIKFVMNTDPTVGDIREILRQIYSNIYVEFAVKNPLCNLEQWIDSELFRDKLETFVQGLKI
eukprot:Colp12_sorted_trinity150504_noHs@35924